MERNNSSRFLAEAALTIALAVVFSRIRLYRLPQGGSITLEIVPLLILALRWGLWRGIAAGAVIAARRRWRFPGAAPADGREGEGAQRPAHSFGRALRTPGMLAYTGLCAALILVVTFLT